MKVLIFISALVFTVFTSSAQSTDKKVLYKAEGIYFIQLDKTGKEIARKPEGQDVSVHYDIFFKSYDIFYTDEDGATSILKLDYIGNGPSGSVKMKDKSNNIYYVTDLLQTIGKLKILIPKDYGNISVWMVVEKAVKS